MAFMVVCVLVVALAVGVALFSNDSFRLFGDGLKSRGLFDIFGSDQAKKFERIGSYDKKFEDDATKDPSMVDDYYTIATDFYEYGWGQSFHFAGRKHGESFEDSIRRHEQIISDAIGMKPGMTALDCGSGVGGPARAVAAHSGGNVMGISINDYQIERSRKHTKAEGLDKQVSFTQGDFTAMSFEENSFDAAYAIEATCHAPKLEDVYGEIFRVVKPGALFGSYEWITTPHYDAEDPVHKKAVYDIEYGNGLPPLRNAEQVLAAAKAVGFELVREHDLVHDETEETYTWYHRMDMNTLSYYMTHVTCYITETLGLAPKGTIDTHAMLMHALDGLVAGGRTKLFTPMHLFVFRKPATAAAPAKAAPAAPVKAAPAAPAVVEEAAAPAAPAVVEEAAAPAAAVEEAVEPPAAAKEATPAAPAAKEAAEPATATPAE